MKNILLKSPIYYGLLLIIGLLSSCQKEQITLSADAHDTFFLEEKGNSMPIQVHGNVASNKMLVIIHGGPGGNGITYRDEYVKNNVEKEFAVVYWDQRLAGAAQGNSSSSEIALFKADTRKVLQLLKSRYGADKKMYVMGHSWGGFVTPYFLEDSNNQDLVKGWIQVDGAHNYYKNDSLTKEMLLVYGKKEIAKAKNTDKWQEIVDFCNAHPYNESADVAFSLNRYAGRAEGYLDEVTAPIGSGSLLTRLTANNFAATAQISNIVKSALIDKIDRQAYDKQISENLYKIKVPTLLLWGRHDFVCPIGLKDDIKKYIGSKDISEKTFEKSGHSPMLNEPAAFWTEVITWVKKH
jgi:pimeloyl-ACP methyl ester carboxylesterase